MEKKPYSNIIPPLPVFEGKIRLDSFMHTVRTMRNTHLVEPPTFDNINFGVFNGHWGLPKPPRVNMPRLVLNVELAKLIDQSPSRVVRLWGAVGNGKSHFAYCYAKERYGTEYQALLWFDLQGDNEDELHKQFYFLAQGLAVESLQPQLQTSGEVQFIEGSYVDSKKNFYQLILAEVMKSGPVLIVLDSVQHYKAVKICMEAINELQKDNNITVLVTTRNQNSVWDNATTLNVPPFSEQEAAQFVELSLRDRERLALRDAFSSEVLKQHSGMTPLCISQLIEHICSGSSLELFDLLSDAFSCDAFGQNSYIVRIAEIIDELSRYKNTDRLLNSCASIPRGIWMPGSLLEQMFSDQLEDTLKQFGFYSAINDHPSGKISMLDELHIVTAARMTRVIKQQSLSDLWFWIVCYFSDAPREDEDGSAMIELAHSVINSIFENGECLIFRDLSQKSPYKNIFIHLNSLIDNMLHKTHANSTDDFRFLLWMYQKRQLRISNDFVFYLFAKSAFSDEQWEQCRFALDNIVSQTEAVKTMKMLLPVEVETYREKPIFELGQLGSDAGYQQREHQFNQAVAAEQIHDNCEQKRLFK